MEEIIYPIRINRYLALHNICSRREGDALIEKGVVLINGKKAKIGDKVNESDKVTVNSKATDVMKICLFCIQQATRNCDKFAARWPKEHQRHYIFS